MKKPHKSVAMLVTIDEEGNATKRVLFDSKDQKMIIRPKIGLQQNPKEVYIYGVKGNKQRFGKITFNDSP
jgi:hypothetical protein